MKQDCSSPNRDGLIVDILIEINIISGSRLIRFTVIFVPGSLAGQLESDHQGRTFVAIECE